MHCALRHIGCNSMHGSGKLRGNFASRSWRSQCMMRQHPFIHKKNRARIEGSLSFYSCSVFVSDSRKRVEHIRFGSADFPLYFADFFLNIRIFLKKIGSSMKKSATSKLLRTIRQINFRLILSDFDEIKC